MAIVVNGDLRRRLMSHRLAGLREFVAPRTLDEDVAVIDPDGLAGQPDQALDITDFRLFGITEHDDVPALWRPAARQKRQVVRKHHHQDSVALETRLGVEVHGLIPAVDAQPGVNERETPTEPRLPVTR